MPTQNFQQCIGIGISNLPNFGSFLFLTAKFYIRPLAGFAWGHNFNGIIHRNCLNTKINNKMRECTVLLSQTFTSTDGHVEQMQFADWLSWIYLHLKKTVSWIYPTLIKYYDFNGLFLKNHADLFITDKIVTKLFFYLFF